MEKVIVSILFHASVVIVARRFDKEFKEHAVKLVVDGRKQVTETARQLDISPKTLHKWVSDYKQFCWEWKFKTEDAAMRDLKKRLKDLEEKM
jgi:transposase